MQYKQLGLCTFRVNRMRDFSLNTMPYPAFWCILQKANVSVTWWHLNFPCTSKFHMEDLYPVWYLLCISLGNFQCLHLYCLTLLEKKGIPLLLMCIALSTATEWSQSNCFIISNTPFGNQKPTVNKLCTTIFLWRCRKPLELMYTI